MGKNAKLFIISFICLLTTQLAFCQKIVDGKVVYHEKDSAYQPMYDSIKTQYIKKLQAPEYKNYRALRKSYNEKLGDNYNGVEIKEDPGHSSWLTFFWPKTGFKSLAEALYNWNVVAEAQDKSDKKSKQLTHILSLALLKYGPNIFMDVVREVKEQYPEL